MAGHDDGAETYLGAGGARCSVNQTDGVGSHTNASRVHTDLLGSKIEPPEPAILWRQIGIGDGPTYTYQGMRQLKSWRARVRGLSLDNSRAKTRRWAQTR